MVDDIRSLDIHIKSTQKARSLPVKTVANFLDQLQTTIFHIGDSIAGGDFRVRGQSTDAVIDRCELIFEDVKKGSFMASLTLQDHQKVLTGTSLGEESLKKFWEITQHIATSDAPKSDVILQVIKDPLHRTRVLDDLKRLWPAEGRGFSVELAPPRMQRLTLPAHKKFFIEELLKREEGQKGKVAVKGVLHNIASYPSDVMKITGPDGTISLPMEDIQTATKYFDKPIIAYGEARFDAAGNVAELLNVTKIQPFKEIPINRILSERGELKLSKPLIAQVDWNYKQWTMAYPDLNIISTAKDYDECLKDFQEQFFFVWKFYGLGEDSSFSPGAKNLKKKVLSLIKETPHL